MPYTTQSTQSAYKTTSTRFTPRLLVGYFAAAIRAAGAMAMERWREFTGGSRTTAATSVQIERTRHATLAAAQTATAGLASERQVNPAPVLVTTVKAAIASERRRETIAAAKVTARAGCNLENHSYLVDSDGTPLVDSAAENLYAVS